MRINGTEPNQTKRNETENVKHENMEIMAFAREYGVDKINNTPL